jgi:LmbE family N-acetylglucosaminyl deacetylase
VLALTSCNGHRPPDPHVDRIPLVLEPGDRIMVLAPHPDDEVLACGNIIRQAKKLGLPLRVVFLTYGDNNEWSFILYRHRPVLRPSQVRAMGRVRYKEAHKADAALGAGAEELVFLGYPDYRTLKIWYQHWHDRPPCLSCLTQVREVPYSTAYRPHAPYKGDDILSDLRDIIGTFQPTKVFVSHPADENPDHQALYLFTTVALWDLALSPQPRVYPYLTHFETWPSPRTFAPRDELNPPLELGMRYPWMGTELSLEDITYKTSALKKHVTQYRASKKYLLSFMRTNELFGDEPPIVVGDFVVGQPVVSGPSLQMQMPSRHLTSEERKDFTGLEAGDVYLRGDRLTFDFKLSKPIGQKIGVSLYAFGYRDDVPFPEMPKIKVDVGFFQYVVRDQDERVPASTVDVKRDKEQVRIRIPLDLLGFPQRMLVGVETRRGDVSLDWAGWRQVMLDAPSACQSLMSFSDEP